MEDHQIVALYWERAEQAIAETETKYGGYCYSIAHNILGREEDARETVNDTWMDAWQAMPPHRPKILSTFLGKITRRISIDRWRIDTAAKRGGSQMPLALEELAECVSGYQDVETEILRRERSRIFQSFLEDLAETQRSVFLCRYWYLDPVEAIAREFGFSQSKVTSMLHRTRRKLRERLEKEGYA